MVPPKTFFAMVAHYRCSLESTRLTLSFCEAREGDVPRRCVESEPEE